METDPKIKHKIECLCVSLVSGLQSFLHQEVLLAMCGPKLGAVPPSDPGRAGQEEAKLQGSCVMTGGP